MRRKENIKSSDTRRGLKRAALVLVSLILLGVRFASAADLYPTPEFSNHPIPQSQTPAVRASWHEPLDLVFLAVALAAASYFAVRGRSRAGLFTLSIVSLAWLGFWRKGCVCPIGAIQNVTQSLLDSQYAAGWMVLLVFVLPLAVTLFFGRSFCASVCPLGAVQELVAVRPVQVPPWIDHALGLLAFVYLGAAVLFAATGSAWIICRYDPFVGLFRMTSSAKMLALSAAFLGVGLFIGRPYCRWLCPYGALLGLLSRLSWRHLRIDPKGCVQCRLCEDACPYGAIQRPTIALPPKQRLAGRLRLAGVLALAPLLVAAGACAGYYMRNVFASVDRNVQLAEEVRADESAAGRAKGDSPIFAEAKIGTVPRDEVEAFRGTGESVESLYAAEARIRRKFAIGGTIFGGWVGLVFGVKLVRLSIRRRRKDYEPDRAACVSCGRCFWYCPEEHQRQELIQIE